MRLRSVWLVHWLVLQLLGQPESSVETLGEIEEKLRQLALRESVANVAAYAEYVRRLLVGGAKVAGNPERDIEMALYILKPMSQMKVFTSRRSQIPYSKEKLPICSFIPMTLILR